MSNWVLGQTKKMLYWGVMLAVALVVGVMARSVGGSIGTAAAEHNLNSEMEQFCTNYGKEHDNSTCSYYSDISQLEMKFNVDQVASETTINREAMATGKQDIINELSKTISEKDRQALIKKGFSWKYSYYSSDKQLLFSIVVNASDLH